MAFNRPTAILKYLALIAFMVFIFSQWSALYPWPAESTTETSPRDPFAYVFYSTQDAYACSALVNIHLLKTLHQSKHRFIVLLSKDVSSKYRKAFKTLGAEVVEEKPLPLHRDSSDYYRGCLLKLSAFRLHEIDPTVRRVLVLDSDQLVLRGLDDLFELPPADIYAPAAYWLDSTFLTTALMLIQPSEGLWSRIQQAVASLAPQEYDMDIVNALFGEDAKRLPDSYVVLNSHWEEWNLPSWFKPQVGVQRHLEKSASHQDLDQLGLEAHVVHYTAGGKPWSRDMYTVGEFKGHAHPMYLAQWEEWRVHALALCPPGVINHL